MEYGVMRMENGVDNTVNRAGGMENRPWIMRCGLWEQWVERGGQKVEVWTCEGSMRPGE